MVVLPAFLAVTTPFLLTLATVGLLDVQVIAPADPEESVAFSVSLLLMFRVFFVLFSVILLGAYLTVSL